MTIIEALNKNRLVKIKGIKKLVNEWGDLRNPVSHGSFDVNQKIFSNRIRALPEGCPRAKDIFAKLNRLESYLTPEKLVPSHCKGLTAFLHI